MSLKKQKKPVFAETVLDYEIGFNDVDSMHVVWHGHHIRFFELARTKLFKEIGYDYPDMRESGYYWPVIECNCKYIKAISYGTTLQIIARVTEIEYRLKFEYEIVNKENGDRFAKGHTHQVAVRIDNFEMCLVSPSVLKEKFEL